MNEELLLRGPCPSDADDLMALAREYCEENNIEYDDQTLKMYLYIQIKQIPSIVAVLNNKVVGAISFAILPDQYKSGKHYAEKLATFVTKECRNTGIGTALLNRAEEICKKQGITKFYFKGTKRPKGYTEIEKQYMKDLK